MKVTFTRKEAIEGLESFRDEEDETDFNAMTNEQLGEVLCCSGYIHDEDFDKVID